MDLPCKVHRHKKTNTMWYHSYVECNFLKIQMNLLKKTKQIYRDWKQNYGYQRGKCEEDG